MEDTEPPDPIFSVDPGAVVARVTAPPVSLTAPPTFSEPPLLKLSVPPPRLVKPASVRTALPRVRSAPPAEEPVRVPAVIAPPVWFRAPAEFRVTPPAPTSTLPASVRAAASVPIVTPPPPAEVSTPPTLNAAAFWKLKPDPAELVRVTDRLSTSLSADAFPLVKLTVGPVTSSDARGVTLPMRPWNWAAPKTVRP